LERGFLHKYFLNNGDKMIHKWFHYFDIYEHHFERFRDQPVKVLEIGVFKGGSLKMWKDYFHKDSVIVGIDINPKCKQHEQDGIHVRIGSQVDEEFLADIIIEFGPFDIIIDDGSHENPHVIETFNLMYPHISKTGVYLVEDMHTSYWPKYGGGLHKSDSMVEYFKSKIDELNAVHIGKNVEVTDFTRTTSSITFYDSVAVFEKRPQGQRHSIKTQKMLE